MASFSLHENAPPVILMIHAGAISHAYVGSASVLVGDIDDALDSEKVVEELLSHFVEELLSAEHRVNGSVIHSPSEFDAASVAFEIPILTYG
ncbi:hypothetical protein JHK87_022675 [Glycine soja]|nr:hypothetical protein JHK87_022675 [Glycine soja]